MLVSEISLLNGGGGGGEREWLKNGNASKCANFEILFSLAYRMYKSRVCNCDLFWGCYYIRVKNFVADAVFEGVTASKSVQNDIFMAFLSVLFFYHSICQSRNCQYFLFWGYIIENNYNSSPPGYMQWKAGVKNLKFFHLQHYSDTRILLHIECTGGETCNNRQNYSQMKTSNYQNFGRCKKQAFIESTRFIISRFNDSDIHPSTEHNESLKQQKCYISPYCK